MQYFGNEVDGQDMGIIISTLDGCLPCLALLGCDCQKSAAQMLNDQLAGDDGGDPNLRTIANVVGQTGSTIFGAWQAGEAAKKGIEAGADKATSIATLAVAGVAIATVGYVLARVFGR